MKAMAKIGLILREAIIIGGGFAFGFALHYPIINGLKTNFESAINEYNNASAESGRDVMYLQAEFTECSRKLKDSKEIQLTIENAVVRFLKNNSCKR